jgi:hypothetical protein
MTMAKWIRVSRRLVCPVCGRPDWCLVADDGTAAICPRTESAKRCGDAGWLHRLVDCPAERQRFNPWHVPLHRESKVRVEEIAAISRRLQAMAEKSGAIDRLAAQLGLSPQSLVRFGVGWSFRDNFSSWPMFDWRGWIVGLNRRFADGSKKMMAGHRAGLYMPADLPQDLSGVVGTLLITEGATDAVAALDLGFWAVGRFSCNHGIELLVKLVSRIRPARLVLVGDADEPGRRGVESLASVLLAYVRQLKVVYPPQAHKDLRAWKKVGATCEDLMRVIGVARLRRLGVEVRRG